MRGKAMNLDGSGHKGLADLLRASYGAPEHFGQVFGICCEQAMSKFLAEQLRTSFEHIRNTYEHHKTTSEHVRKTYENYRHM